MQGQETRVHAKATRIHGQATRIHGQATAKVTRTQARPVADRPVRAADRPKEPRRCTPSQTRAVSKQGPADEDEVRGARPAAAAVPGLARYSSGRLSRRSGGRRSGDVSGSARPFKLTFRTRAWSVRL